MMSNSLSQHPISGRVFARHRNDHGVGFADDLNIYVSLKTASKVLVEMRQRFGEDAKLSFNMTKSKFTSPDIITVTGLKCVGVPIGTPEFVNEFVRSKAHAI
jgi:hypothetical protein